MLSPASSRIRMSLRPRLALNGDYGSWGPKIRGRSMVAGLRSATGRHVQYVVIPGPEFRGLCNCPLWSRTAHTIPQH